MADVSKLLYSRGGDAPSFLASLELTAQDHILLKDAQKKVRDRLRTTFATLTKAEIGMSVRPRFFTQGSYSYRTINGPAWTPPQQMDLDDGAYLPMTFVQGTQRPSVASAGFFKIVDNALIKLAQEESWQFKRKPTCARLVISDSAHIDVPLYAIPDAEFKKLEEALVRKSVATFDARPRALDRWDALPSDCVLLAHREDDWVSSDPRKICDWFDSTTDIYGERFRRICRFLKAWRDHNRPHLDNVSSLLLMVCAWEAFEDLGRPNVPVRDDLALLKVAERLPRLLEGPVWNPADPDSANRSTLDWTTRVANVPSIWLMRWIANSRRSSSGVSTQQSRSRGLSNSSAIAFHIDLILST
ncbi:CBASS cGAMP synthase [Rhodopseudomonas palustris]|uniref:CBASS cGAMP synthase n=1 Tax=Rhodopseudomonas palustris TaxID=1076 RepID=UPI0021F360EA|nr:CBASS cGAMP synthase [Rhodopseudomonas palustris]UYO55183.1 hypothetical protein KQX61_07210 [Rhodopseudomonas palustris]